MVADFCRFVCINFPLSMLVLAILVGLVRGQQEGQYSQKIVAYLFLLPVGLSGLWGFVIHAFFPYLADQNIGWAWSPFEFEVAVTNLGMGLLGIFAFRINDGFRLATALFVATFSWGAAAGHIYQMVIAHNFNPGNAGIIFYTDIFIPLILWIFLWLSRKRIV